jgi:Fuc2NAc and GlcNAc transferase
MGWPPSFEVASFIITTGRVGAVFAVIWLVTVTNFYNFMDGIDGLAAAQGIVAGMGIASFGTILGIYPMVLMGAILFGASIGFLILNRSPAKIFMGDCGSYSIGIYIASFVLIDRRLLVPIVLLLGVFVFDATVTLIKRVISGEKVYRAHRDHFYQKAVSLGYGHLRVTAILSFIMVLLMAMACVYINALPLIQVLILIIAIIVLSTAATWVILKEKSIGRDMRTCS